MRTFPLSFVLFLIAALSGCGSTPVRDTAPADRPAAAAAHDNLNATLWMESAAEYEAAVRGAYTAAKRSLDTALATPSWHALPRGEAPLGFESLPPAIIVDADETFISNEPFQARVIRDAVKDFDYDRWLAWTNERKATALPGAVDFAQYVASRGVTIFYVTNRDYPAEYESTVANLRAQGFPVADDAGNVLLRGTPRAPSKEKGERRKLVAQTHRVLLLLGDNLGDFLDGINAGTQQRRNVMAPYAAWWGERWFMLPNPSYGSWESAVMKDCGERADTDPTGCKRDALRYD
ncbi:5'-nucleotidase, lipoprotein e(P4) family [Chiayiivirga flava]|uniref:Acid phosphatase n=1 Tax=Chiayiivirga flava TaxID=659595 RepID=A0A7W8D8J7_9GAMM|nr:HAD family acid phosphatase [Chiayiivirga flava]MBB5209592.1 acid phosphatase [Chiayiivirga flava]